MILDEAIVRLEGVDTAATDVDVGRESGHGASPRVRRSGDKG
jgi:hypothetical protein